MDFMRTLFRRASIGSATPSIAGDVIRMRGVPTDAPSGQEGRPGGRTANDSALPGEQQMPSSAGSAAADRGQNCTALPSREICVWGWNADGQLGLGDDEDRLELTVLPSAAMEGREPAHVACGPSCTCVVTVDGSLFVWGLNGSGSIGFSGVERVPAPRQLCGPAEGYVVKQVACGATHIAAVCDDGAVAVWGAQDCGNFGSCASDGATDIEPDGFCILPAQLFGGQPVTAVACGAQHTLALTKDGSVFGWGNNSCGQLGLGEAAPDHVAVPTRIDIGTAERATQLAAGAAHSVVLCGSGTVVVWGKNAHGQLGLGREVSYAPLPRSLQPSALGDRPAIQVACGRHFTALLTDDGVVRMCGDNSLGQLGLGRRLVPTGGTASALRVLVSVPAAIPPAAFGGRLVTRIVCGGAHCLALTDDGGLFVWGRNAEGFLGLGHTEDQTFPARVPLHVAAQWQVADVALGQAHCVLLRMLRPRARRATSVF